MKKCFIFFIWIFFISLNWAFAEEGNSLNDLKKQAGQYYAAENYSKAVDVTRQALTMAQKQFGPESLEAAELLGNLGSLYLLQNKTAQGQQLLEEAKRIRDKHGFTGIPLGIQSEVFFNFVAKHKVRNNQNDVGGQYSGSMTEEDMKKFNEVLEKSLEKSKKADSK